MKAVDSFMLTQESRQTFAQTPPRACCVDKLDQRLKLETLPVYFMYSVSVRYHFQSSIYLHFSQLSHLVFNLVLVNYNNLGCMVCGLIRSTELNLCQGVLAPKH